MKLSTTDFGHLGIFPETRGMLGLDSGRRFGRIFPKTVSPSILNLFAYSGRGATLAPPKSGRTKCSIVDAIQGQWVQWARGECRPQLDWHEHPIGWIVDDCNKFIQREVQRRPPLRCRPASTRLPSAAGKSGEPLTRSNRPCSDTLRPDAPAPQRDAPPSSS